ncbi:MAG: 50S ribosomal protein L31 [Candidatus Margulisiibacteriota bacterium]
MKKKTHPQNHEVVATCHCGGSFKIMSTLKDVRVDICSACHPVFAGSTGKRLMDTEGLVDKFKKRYANTAKIQAEIKDRKVKKAEVVAELAKEEKARKESKKSRVIGKTKV